MSDQESDAILDPLCLKIFTWNIEGISRNKYNLFNLSMSEKPSVMFLAEPWLHLCDAPLATSLMSSSYCHFLNSEDGQTRLPALS